MKGEDPNGGLLINAAGNVYLHFRWRNKGRRSRVRFYLVASEDGLNRFETDLGKFPIVIFNFFVSRLRRKLFVSLSIKCSAVV